MTSPLSKDQAFIDRLSEIVLANLRNENFGVNELARLAGLSRSVIHRKLRAIKKQNITQFICEIRLKRAMQLLQNHAGPASDVAFKVGFGSPSYFNKCFHEYFGYPPGEVKKMIHPENVSVHNQTHESENTGNPIQIAAEGKSSGAKKANRRMVIIILVAFLVVLTVASALINGSRNNAKDMSIVVLPFNNLSDDPNNQYIADGIMEDILNNLYNITELRVVSRTTSEYLRTTNLTSREIAQKVKARNVLEGSIRRQDDKIRISIQLIDAKKDNHLWAANFDCEIENILGVQGDIALQVANKLNAVISDNEVRKIGELPTKNPEAYDYYLKGRFLLHKSISEQRTDINNEGLTGSLQYFEKAINADSSFAEAYAGLAQAYFDLSAWGWRPVKEGFLKAKELSIKALELDPDCAEAHTVLGAFHAWGDRQFEEARREFLAALHLKPNYPVVNQYYAQLLMIVGPIEEARTYMNRTLEMEPYFWVVHNLNAWIYYFEEEYNKALKACVIARDLKPDFGENQWLFFLNYAKIGDGVKAMKELQSIASSYPVANQYADEILDAYNKSGIEGLFLWLVDVNTHGPIPVEGMNGHPFFVAWWYAILGKKEESISWLERNMESKMRLYSYFNLIATNPDFDILRDDPRFLRIIDEIGLTPYNTRKAK